MGGSDAPQRGSSKLFSIRWRPPACPHSDTLSVEAARQLMIEASSPRRASGSRSGRSRIGRSPAATARCRCGSTRLAGRGPFPITGLFSWWWMGHWRISTAYDATCRALTNAAGCIVVGDGVPSGARTQIPPCAPEDCYAATQWVRCHHAAAIGGDPARLAIGGDSAGGNLTAVGGR